MTSRIGRDDPRYREVVDKRFNKRFSASPDYVRLVSSTDEVLSAVDAGATVGETFRTLFEGFTAGSSGRSSSAVSVRRAIAPNVRSTTTCRR